MKLEVSLAGLKLKNPTMLAAGVLGLTGLTMQRVAEAGAGAIVTKSIGMKARIGYPNPTLVEVSAGLLNAMGLPNPGAKEFAKEIKIAKGAGVPIIASIYGSNSGEFAEVAKLLEKAGADAFELNLSCPHVKEVGMEMGRDLDLVSEVVKRVRSAVKKPIFTKLSPNVTDIVEIAKAAEKAGSDAITAVNTVRAMAIDIETARPILSNKIGGLSGPAIKPIAVRCVYEIYKEVDIPVIGCGGIMNWQDAVEFMLVGATCIQIGTAIAYRGLSVFKEITDGIEAYLRRKGYESIDEIIGLAHQ